jgi:hypothetical protein
MSNRSVIAFIKAAAVGEAYMATASSATKICLSGRRTVSSLPPGLTRCGAPGLEIATPHAAPVEHRARGGPAPPRNHHVVFHLVVETKLHHQPVRPITSLSCLNTITLTVIVFRQDRLVMQFRLAEMAMAVADPATAAGDAAGGGQGRRNALDCRTIVALM